MIGQFQQFKDDLVLRKSQFLYRSRLQIDSPSGTKILMDGKNYLTFCSNDYLGLANHPKVKEAFIDGVKRWGVGSGSAHLVVGHTTAHHQLEEALADFTGRQKALLFSSGYMANQGVISSLLKKGDHIFQDKLNHASLIDAASLSAAKLHRYLHCDASSLGRQLEGNDGLNTFVASDGVFSMDGDVAPLPELVKKSEQSSSLLMIDDAHGFGVSGRNGKGSLEYFHLDDQQVPILMATLGKALGTSGAFIAGNEALIDFILQKARSYIFTTAPPAAIAEATLVSLQLLKEESWRRERLQQLIHYFKQGAQQIALPLNSSDTAIQPLMVGSAEQAVHWSDCLKEKGILVTAIRPPTVPNNTARLRLTFSAEHTEKQIDYLLDALSELNKARVTQ